MIALLVNLVSVPVYWGPCKPRFTFFQFSFLLPSRSFSNHMYSDDDDRQVETLFSAIDHPHGERILAVCVSFLQAFMGGSLGLMVRLSHCTLDLFMWTSLWLGVVI